MSAVVTVVHILFGFYQAHFQATVVVVSTEPTQARVQGQHTPLRGTFATDDRAHVEQVLGQRGAQSSVANV